MKPKELNWLKDLIDAHGRAVAYKDSIIDNKRSQIYDLEQQVTDLEVDLKAMTENAVALQVKLTMLEQANEKS